MKWVPSSASYVVSQGLIQDLSMGVKIKFRALNQNCCCGRNHVWLTTMMVRIQSHLLFMIVMCYLMNLLHLKMSLLLVSYSSFLTYS